jgi:hypothetical protein
MECFLLMLQRKIFVLGMLLLLLLMAVQTYVGPWPRSRLLTLYTVGVARAFVVVDVLIYKLQGRGCETDEVIELYQFI